MAFPRSLTSFVEGYSHYSHREHAGYDELLPHPHLKTPQNGHRERNSRDVHHEVEYSDEQIERLLITTEAIDGLIPEKCKRPAYQTAS